MFEEVSFALWLEWKLGGNWLEMVFKGIVGHERYSFKGDIPSER